MMTTTTTRSTYHHGDLRAALVAAGLAMLETGEPFSLRALARQAGAVSYTHLRAHQTVLDLVCPLLLEKKKTHTTMCYYYYHI